MEMGKLGNSDLYISRLGVGAWAIGGPGYIWGWGPQDDNQSIGAIHAVLDAGINWMCSSRMISDTLGRVSLCRSKA